MEVCFLVAPKFQVEKQFKILFIGSKISVLKITVAWSLSKIGTVCLSRLCRHPEHNLKVPISPIYQCDGNTGVLLQSSVAPVIIVGDIRQHHTEKKDRLCVPGPTRFGKILTVFDLGKCICACSLQLVNRLHRGRLRLTHQLGCPPVTLEEM